MSADNWRKCPKCLKVAKESREKATQRAQAKYGKISESEYRKLIAKAESPIELNETMRENYCQRIDEDGEFQSSYYCYCERCGFEFQHKYGQAVDLE
jgi:predicted HNH restriction endonuclease